MVVARRKKVVGIARNRGRGDGEMAVRGGLLDSGSWRERDKKRGRGEGEMAVKRVKRERERERRRDTKERERDVGHRDGGERETLERERWRCCCGIHRGIELVPIS